MKAIKKTIFLCMIQSGCAFSFLAIAVFVFSDYFFTLLDYLLQRSAHSDSAFPVLTINWHYLLLFVLGIIMLLFARDTFRRLSMHIENMGMQLSKRQRHVIVLVSLIIPVAQFFLHSLVSEKLLNRYMPIIQFRLRTLQSRLGFEFPTWIGIIRIFVLFIIFNLLISLIIYKLMIRGTGDGTVSQRDG